MNAFQLIYVSIAADAFTPETLLEILQISRTNNARDGVTGLLLYKERRFMQLLEGEEAIVRATYARILRDPRHRDVTTLLEETSAMRDFEDWSMGFQDLEEAAARGTPGLSPFLEASLSVFDFASDPSRAHQLLRIFRRM